jgi:predicted O-linked N-acetylglucosamine transferase (SPINDLY family)
MNIQRSSELLDAAGLARALEDAYAKLWRRYVAARAATIGAE